MIGYERGSLERLICSQERMRLGSPLCKTLDSIKEITTWAQEPFVQQLSVNSSFANDYIVFLFMFDTASQLFLESGLYKLDIYVTYEQSLCMNKIVCFEQSG